MDKQHKKQKIDKLQKKLENRNLSIYQILQEDIAVDWFKMLNPAFISMLNSKTFGQIISYVVKVGPPDNKIRSYKIPMIATQILSAPMPKVFELFFMEDDENKGQIMLAKLLAYFDGTPNYVLSGYIVKILINLMAGNAPKVLEYLFKNSKIMKCPKFLESFSIAEFLLRIIVVEDILLNNKIKERLQLFNMVADIYSENKQSEEILDNANYFLTESIIRLWSHKHKQLGRFSSSIFRVVQFVIDKNNLYHQQNLIVVIMKHLTTYSDEAPFLIVALFKKINRQLSLLGQTQQKVKTQFKQNIVKFGSKNLKLLQALSSMFVNVPEIMIKQLKTNNVFLYLLDFVIRYQWNSILLVELQKIIKLILGPVSSLRNSVNIAVENDKKDQNKKKQSNNYEALYGILFTQAGFHSRIKQWIKKETQRNQKSRGYSGFLFNICKYVVALQNQGTVSGQLIKKHHPQLIQTVQNHIRSKQQPQKSIEGFQIVHDVAKPCYNINTLVDQFSKFFQETQNINKKYQIERPTSHHIQSQELLQQIEIQNQLVYKLMTEHSEENKKSETSQQITQ